MINNLFYIDPLAVIMISLIGFVSLLVGTFSLRYMQYDNQYHLFFIKMIILSTALVSAVSANNIIIFATSWLVAYMMLIVLMIHKFSWKAAWYTGFFTAINYGCSILCMIFGLLSLYLDTHSLDVQVIMHQTSDSIYMSVGLLLLLCSALMQSALWPFHKWLLSSLNAPLPVSAIMHAGIINGGGFLIIRFAHVYLQHPWLLYAMFIIGSCTAIIGTLYYLVQTDIKRMFACSTMAQMGFMIAQCGLGLFSFAMSHLCWHGLFKAYLFLNNNNNVLEPRIECRIKLTMQSFWYAMISGIIASITFGLIVYQTWPEYNTALFSYIVVYIIAAQSALSFAVEKFYYKNVMMVTFGLITGSMYGLSVYSIETLLSSMDLFHPQPLTIVHLCVISSFVFMWFIIMIACTHKLHQKFSERLMKWYIYVVNASQPYALTITTHRNDYKYL